MPKMSIYQALQQVKLYEKRVSKLRSEIAKTPVGFVQGMAKNVKGTALTPQEFTDRLVSKEDEKRDLEANIFKIKAEIAKANVNNTITVLGQEYTPIHLINMTSADSRETAENELVVLRNAYSVFEREYNEHVMSAHSKAVEAVKSFLPSQASLSTVAAKLYELGNTDVKLEDTEVFKSKEFSDTCLKAYREALEMNLPKMVDPLHIVKTIEEKQKKLDDFYVEANMALTRFNIETLIEF